MQQLYALLIVAATAGIFVLIHYYRKRKVFPLCDKFAARYCELADRVLPGLDCEAELAVETIGGGLLRLKPAEEQPPEIQAVLRAPVDDAIIAMLRELYFLRDDIQSHASNGNLSKDKYNAITNHIFDTINSFLAVVSHPQDTISQKELDNFHYCLHMQKHIRNVTLPSIVSKDCAQTIAVS